MTSEHRIRKEIQFLRAVAVTLVVLSHTGISFFHGGFVGVDMFFVISGYVIGLSLIREQLSTGKVSILHFLQRRFFRIYPPLALMVVGASFYAYFILPFDKSQDYFIQQARAALLSYGNFFYMFQKVDYFLTNPNLTFFLHTWSLGIEEQFYLLIPVLIYLVSKVFRKSGKHSALKGWNALFIAIFLISVLSCITLWTGRLNWVSGEFQSLMLFYSPLSRAWEFLMGILIAINSSRRIQRRSDFLLYQGIFLVALAIVGSATLDFSQFLSSTMAAIGTGLFIYSSINSDLTEIKIFSNRIFTFIGDRSYSIYLWHWIAVAVAEDLFQKIVSREKVALIAVSLIPAFFSYKYVEAPSKKIIFMSKSKKIFTAITIVAVPITSLSILDALTFKSRENYGNVFVQNVLEDCNYWEQVCTIGGSSTSEKILLLGDSHAYQLIPIFQSLSLTEDVEITTCVKVCFENEYQNISDNSFQKTQNFDVVITMFKTNTGNTLRDVRMELSKSISGFAMDRNSKLLVVLDNPFFEEFKSPRRIKHPQLFPIPRESQVLSEEVRLDWVKDAGSEVIFFDTFNSLCSQSECWVEKNGKVLYVDNNHLSMPGVRLLEPSLIALVNQILDK